MVFGLGPTTVDTYRQFNPSDLTESKIDAHLWLQQGQRMPRSNSPLPAVTLAEQCLRIHYEAGGLEIAQKPALPAPV